MNAGIRQIRTAAEQGIAEMFAAIKGELPGDATERQRAFDVFAGAGLPHRRIEAWKYTDLRAAMRAAKPLASTAQAALSQGRSADLLAHIEARRLVFGNGRMIESLSDLADIEPGLTIETFDSVLGRDAAALAGDALAPANDDAAVALNTAFTRDGVVIRVAEGATLRRPLHLLFTVQGEAAAVYSRVVIDVGAGAKLALIETHESAAGRDDQINMAIDLVVGDRAHVDHVKFGLESENTLHVASWGMRLGAASHLNTFILNVGGGLVRNQIFAECQGDAATLRFGGVNLLTGRQHADTTLTLNHVAPGCQSRELFKSVLDGRSRGVFQGRISVQPQAQKTDARMMTRALLLSEDAEADMKPELEIFADDVQCGHGATAGALDDNLKFYLMARGLPEKEAESLLIQAFIGDAVETVEDAGLREVLMLLAVEWLEAR